MHFHNSEIQKFNVLVSKQSMHQAVKLPTDISLLPLMSDEDKYFCGSLVLDLESDTQHGNDLYVVRVLSD